MNNKNTKLLIIRLSSMGDIILTTPLVKLLKLNNPDIEIDYLIADNFKEIIINNPYINKITGYNKSLNIIRQFTFKKEYFKINSFKKYDIIIDLQNNLRSIQFRAGKYSKLLKFDKRRKYKKELVSNKLHKGEPYDLIPDLYINTASELIQDYNDPKLEIWLPSEKENMTYLSAKPPFDGQIIGVAPGAHHFTKRYPPDRFVSIMDSMKGYTFMIIGGKADKEICEYIKNTTKAPAINAYENNSILDTVRNVDKCSLMITNDTGVMHIAAARQVPVVAIFGSTVPELGFGPYKVNNLIVETDIACRPCTHIGRSECPLAHFNCMNEINYNDIILAAGKLLQK